MAKNMSKFKNTSEHILRFELDGKEKVLVPNSTLEIKETNSYIDALKAQGILEEVNNDSK